MQVCAFTDTGRVRTTNQDYIYATPQKVGPLANLLLLADGLGGANAGDYASRFAVERLVAYLSRCPEGEPEVLALRQGITEINRRLYQEAGSNPDLQGMGTTIVAATVSEGTLYVANVGDSRLYLIGEQIVQITRDHSYVEEMVSMGLLSRDSQDYRKNKKYITRALGAEAGVDIDFFEAPLKPGERILLCSDGLTNMVSDRTIKAIVNGPGTLADRARRLIRTANDNGGRDNISVILAEPGESEVAPC